MQGPPIEVHIGGKTYRVVASADAPELHRLAAIVDHRLKQLFADRPIPPQALALVAIALAHDLEEERATRHRFEQRIRPFLSSILQRVDAALAFLQPPQITTLVQSHPSPIPIADDTEPHTAPLPERYPHPPVDGQPQLSATSPTAPVHRPSRATPSAERVLHTDVGTLSPTSPKP